MLTWRVYTRVWNDVGLRPPGQWLVMWMQSSLTTPYKMEAIYWYINECKE